MKRNAILGVFCPKRNVTFFSVSLSKLGTDRNFIKNSVTLLLGKNGWMDRQMRKRKFSPAFHLGIVTVGPKKKVSVENAEKVKEEKEEEDKREVKTKVEMEKAEKGGGEGG